MSFRIEFVKTNRRRFFSSIGIIFAALFLFTIFFFSFSQNKVEFVLTSLEMPLKCQGQNLFLSSIRGSCPESPDFLLIQNNSLFGVSPPSRVTPQVLGVLAGGYDEGEGRKTIIEYEVKSGDNLWSIAARFGISLDTLLWANDLNRGSLIRAGQRLIIPPVSGVIHHVQPGDTISEIAKKYKANVEDIISFNELSNPADIFVGDILIIPNGVMPRQISIRYASSRPKANIIPKNYFICPIPLPCRITQGFHWYNAVDFGHSKCGEPVYAAAGGKVIRVRFGYNHGAGNYVRILHPNGVVTHYGHLSKIVVKGGQSVSQGDIIGFIGYSGYTIPAGPRGCHLHFDVLNVPRGTNPFIR